MKSLFKMAFIAFSMVFFLTQCDKKNDDNPTNSQPDCIKMFDANGSPIGTYGNCANNQDWEATTLSTEDRNFLDFADDLPTTNTSGNLNLEVFYVYPNPIPKGSPFGITFENSDEAYKVKIAIMDLEDNIIFQQAFSSSTQNINVQLPDDFVEMSKYFKVIYQYYSDNQGIIMEGSGHILVCDAPNIANVEEDCF